MVSLHLESSVPIELYKPQLQLSRDFFFAESSVPIELYKPQLCNWGKQFNLS